MKKARIVTYLVLMLVAFSCQELDLWNGEVPENSYEMMYTGNQIVFSQEGQLQLGTTPDSPSNAAVWLPADIIRNLESNNEIIAASLLLDISDIYCRVNKKTARFSADNLQGSVTCYSVNRGFDKVASESLFGKFSFNTKLNRAMYPYGEDNRLCQGDKLSGRWIIHFEADNGKRLLFTLSSVEIVNKQQLF